jgi:single-strand DNA-binding protein
MRDLNKVMLIGNLTKDPDLRSTATGQTVANFSIALNRSWNDQQGIRQDAVEYVDVVAWGKLAEIAGQIYKKGRKTYVEGRLQTRSWDDQATGQKRYKTEVIAENLIILDRPPMGEGGRSSFGEEDQTIAQSPAPAAAGHEDEINIEDIPF